jgi:hypothetical protein
MFDWSDTVFRWRNVTRISYQIPYYSRGIEEAKRTHPMFADWNSGYEYISVVFVACAIYKIDIFFEIWKDDSLNFNENNRNIQEENWSVFNTIHVWNINN